MNDAASSELGLSTNVIAVGVPQYLLPPGITIPEVNGLQPLFPLTIDKTVFNPNNIANAEFVNKHATISQKYLESNFPEFSNLNEETRIELAHDYSQYFTVQLLIYNSLASGAQQSKAEISFQEILHDIADRLTFQKFLIKRLTGTLQKIHPMFSHINQSESNNAFSVQSKMDEEGRTIISITTNNPQIIKDEIRNDKISKMITNKLSTFDIQTLLESITDANKQNQLIKSLPILVDPFSG